jgi:hypothetical protein
MHERRSAVGAKLLNAAVEKEVTKQRREHACISKDVSHEISRRDRPRAFLVHVTGPAGLRRFVVAVSVTICGFLGHEFCDGVSPCLEAQNAKQRRSFGVPNFFRWVVPENLSF